MRNRLAVRSEGHHIKIFKIRQSIRKPPQRGGYDAWEPGTLQSAQLGSKQACHVNDASEQDGEKGRGETGKKQRERDDEGQFQQNEIYGNEQVQIRMIERMFHVKKNQKQARGHRRGIHYQRKQQPSVLAQEKFPAAHRLREQRIEGALFHFLINEADAHENGDEQSDDGNRAKTQIDDYDLLDIERNLPD